MKANENEKSGAIKLANVEPKSANIEALKAKYESAKKAYFEAKGSAQKAPKGPGVIETIFELINKSGEKGLSKKAILAKLEAKFPDRAPEGMAKTIAVQLPKRMSRERKIKIEKLENGNFVVKAPKAPKAKVAKVEALAN